MSMRSHFELCRQAFGPNVYNDFLLAHGREYPVGPNTFAGPRGQQHGCFLNATHLACMDSSMTYCEGKVSCIGVPLDHAWCVDRNGVVVDPTLNGKMLDGNERSAEYFGVPFTTAYILRASKFNKVYGVLDFFYARLTAPKLFELGLEAGQQWLMDQPIPKRTRKKKEAA